MTRSTRIPTTGSDLEDELLWQLRVMKLPIPEVQWRVVPERRFRFDLAWPGHHLACEVDGGTFSGGRHVRGTGYESDCTKLNLAILAGWRVLRFTAAMVHDGRAADMVEKALNR